ncbi:MAG: hypothetical protein R8K53_05215 [Mariprofundaceae bacterium]
MRWDVILSKQAVKDMKNIKQAGLLSKTKVLLQILQPIPLPRSLDMNILSAI